MPNVFSSTAPHPTTERLRSLQTAGGLAAFASLTQSAAELSTMLAQLGDDQRQVAERLRRAQRQPTGMVRSLAEQGARQQAQALGEQASRLRDALAALQRDLSDTAMSDASSAERASLHEQLARDEAKAEALREESLLAGGADAVPARAPKGAQKLGPQNPSVHVQGLLDDKDTDVDKNDARVPSALRAGLSSFARDVRKLAYAKAPLSLGLGDKATDPNVAALQARWADWNETSDAPMLMDPNEMAQWVMRQAYVDTSEDMRAYAYKVHFQTQLKQTIREELNRARTFRSDHGPASDAAGKALSLPYAKKRIRRDPQLNADGAWRVRPVQDDGEIRDANGLDDYIRDLETALSTTSDDMQVSQLELQGMSQRQQQVMNALSSLSKALHETSMAILRKIGN